MSRLPGNEERSVHGDHSSGHARIAAPGGRSGAGEAPQHELPGPRPGPPGRTPVLLVALGILLAAVGVLAGTRVWPTGAAHHEQTVAGTARQRWPLLAPRSGALVGAWVGPQTGPPEQQRQAVTDLEAQLQRRLDIDHHFYPWSKPFPTWRERWDLQAGRIPLISWNGTSTAAIAAGSYDHLIGQRADQVAALGKPVLLRWFWEMDTDNNGGESGAAEVGTPARYIAAWRHIHALFAERGATNVEWVWCPTAMGFTKGDAPAYYPGDDAVDWICADGYSWSADRGSGRWRPFQEIFADFYAWASRRPKPLMIGEFGVQQGDGKAGWIDDARRTLKEHYPAIAAVVYFSSIRSGFDWRIDSSASSSAAFRALAQDAYFRPARPDG